MPSAYKRLSTYDVYKKAANLRGAGFDWKVMCVAMSLIETGALPDKRTNSKYYIDSISARPPSDQYVGQIIPYVRSAIRKLAVEQVTKRKHEHGGRSGYDINGYAKRAAYLKRILRTTQKQNKKEVVQVNNDSPRTLFTATLKHLGLQAGDYATFKDACDIAANRKRVSKGFYQSRRFGARQYAGAIVEYVEAVRKELGATATPAKKQEGRNYRVVMHKSEVNKPVKISFTPTSADVGKPITFEAVINDFD